MMMNESLLANKQREMEFLHHFHQLGYDLIDLGIVETFEWTKLSRDDLHLMVNRHKWQSGDDIYALRSDWTNAIVRYRKQYHLRADKIAYSGPVYSLQSEKHQLGVETFTDSIPKQIEVLGDMIAFMENKLDLSLSVAVVSHNKLLKKILSPKELEDESVRKFITERNPDALKYRLGDDHPIIALMEQAPAKQAGYIKENYPELTAHLNELAEWEEALKRKQVDYVYADMLALPNQSYYKGIFIQLYGQNKTEPVASGGQYTSSSKAFGMAINI
ncbi:ATP phosphoribosyltransferase regulatory subunit [Trichococcus palustris]|nr:ATP phosphoribosyltransferase regulatory subunit [Trichococcus palustris]